MENKSHTIVTMGKILWEVQSNYKSLQIYIIDDKPKLKDVFRLLYSHAGHWKAIATLLGINEHVLESIDKEEKGIHDCLRRMLSAWLKELSPPPMWKDLIDATETIDIVKAQELKKYIMSC